MWGRILWSLGLGAGVCLTAGATDETVETNLPPVVKYEAGENSKEVEVLDLCVVEGYNYKRDGEHSRVEVLDLPFAAVLKAERNEDGETGYRFLHVPLVTVAERDLGENGNSFRLVDVPFFSLVKTRNDDDGDFDRQVVDLPLLGPLFRHKREGDRETTRFLFFKHSRTVADDDDASEAEPNQRRSNAHPG